MMPMSTTRPSRACFLALLALPWAAATAADSLQSVDELQRFAETFVLQRLQSDAQGVAKHHATAGNVDPRLRLSPCTGALQGIMPAGATVAASMTVGVRCANPVWTVYLRMTIETEMPVLVMRAAAARDSSPGADDVDLQQRRVPGIATSYLTQVEQLRGRHLKSAVSPGTILTTDVLAADILIRRGQRVTLVASAGGIEIQAAGEATADASPTGRVKVLNLSSRRIVEGQAESADRVRVSL
jgi:flagella basal body P-ring formation protein FlgA